MILKTGTDDLPLVIQIFRPDEADDTIDEKGFESACDSIGSCFEGQLIDSVMRVGRQSAALTGFEVHHLISHPARIPLAVMRENLLSALAQQAQGDPEAVVGGFGARHRLKKKVHRRPALERRQLSGDMSQTAALRRDLVGVDQALQRREY